MMNDWHVLIVEDDDALRQALADTLDMSDIANDVAATAEEALRRIEGDRPALVISDVQMPGMGGLGLLEALHQRAPEIPVLLMTAHGSIDAAVAAMKHGAVDYLAKPFLPQALLAKIMRFAAPRAERGTPVGSAPATRNLLSLARRVAEADVSVLINGESGTGKEVLARYIHAHSKRVDGPFVAINCAAIPENMLEAMLFGYEKGSFTGAYSSQPGKFELAQGGTLLLDEVSEMSLPLQAKLLRVLQEREVERLGGRQAIKLDIRVLATTNRDMAEEIREARFREDLFYRLNVFPLQCRPLRERREDIAELADFFLGLHGGRMGMHGLEIATEAREVLTAHDWPGNVRELENVMQRALVLRRGTVITADDICFDLGREEPLPRVAVGDGGGLADDLRKQEFTLIADTLNTLSGQRNRAAEKLGISPRTLRYKLAQMREAGYAV